MAIIPIAMAIPGIGLSTDCGKADPSPEIVLPPGIVELARGERAHDELPPLEYWAYGVPEPLDDFFSSSGEPAIYYQESGWRFGSYDDPYPVLVAASPDGSSCIVYVDLSSGEPGTEYYIREIERADPNALLDIAEYSSVLYVSLRECY